MTMIADKTKAMILMMFSDDNSSSSSWPSNFCVTESFWANDLETKVDEVNVMTQVTIVA
jgi:hypothetical protein